MSEVDYAMANRLDRLNIAVSRYLILISLLLLAIDYLRRVNSYTSASLPIPLPSGLVNSLSPLPVIVNRPNPPRRQTPAELEWLARRGDSFVYLTDRPDEANAVYNRLKALRKWAWTQEVFRVDEGHYGITDKFIFESLWFGRGSFIIDSPERSVQLMENFISLLAERRSTRAKARQTVHVVWDLDGTIPEFVQASFLKLAKTTGFSLFVLNRPGGAT
jgi:hypothetical protein